MPKIIPSVTLRDPVADDVPRISFAFTKDPDTSADVIIASVRYQLVDDTEIVFDAQKGFSRELRSGGLFNDLISLRSGKVVNAIKNEEGFS